MEDGSLVSCLPVSVRTSQAEPSANEEDLVSFSGQPNKVGCWKNLHLDTMETRAQPHAGPDLDGF